MLSIHLFRNSHEIPLLCKCHIRNLHFVICGSKLSKCGQVTPPLPLEVSCDGIASSPSLPRIHCHYLKKTRRLYYNLGMDSSLLFLFSWYVLFQVAADLMSIFYRTTFLATLRLYRGFSNYLYTHPSCFTNLYCLSSMNHPRHPMSHCTKLRFFVHILPHLMRCVCQADSCLLA